MSYLSGPKEIWDKWLTVVTISIENVCCWLQAHSVPLAVLSSSHPGTPPKNLLQLLGFSSPSSSFLYNPAHFDLVLSWLSPSSLLPPPLLVLFSPKPPHGPVHPAGHAQSPTFPSALDSSRWLWLYSPPYLNKNLPLNYTLEWSCPHFIHQVPTSPPLTFYTIWSKWGERFIPDLYMIYI